MTVTPNGTRSEQRGERTTKTEAEADTRTTSSRSDAQTRERAIETTHLSRLAAIHPHDALAKIVLTLRPDWTAKAVIGWIANDDRPWAEVCRAALRADDRDIRQPTGLRFVGADYDGAPTPLPPSLDEWRNAKRCDEHGEVLGKCALCRRGIGWPA
jgi:hypothetical protein